MVYGVAFNGARRARGVQVDPLATATLQKCVEYTAKQHGQRLFGAAAQRADPI